MGVETVFVASWSDVRRIALSFPGASENQTRGHRAWIVEDKFFAWERPLRKSDLKALGDDAPGGPILGVRTDGLEMKEAVLASNPSVYFTTPHFDGYPAVLVQLDRVALRELRNLIREAWLARAPQRSATAYLHKKSAPRHRQRSF